MAAEGRSTVHEESNIRDLVENCVNNDDITPLVRLVFEAQSIATDPKDIQADGRQMVALLSASLRGVAEAQQAAVNDISHSNAGAIAATVAELEAVAGGVEEVRGALVAGNTEVQAVGRALVDKAAALQQLLGMASNLADAGAATAAARSVLVECCAAGALVARHQLYAALCDLDTISTTHLGALLQLLQPSKAPAGGSATAAAPTTASAAPGPGGAGGRRALSSSERAALEQLQSYFAALVEELAGAVGALALADFNSWLVSVRAAARDIGMAAIRSARAARAVQEALAAERKGLAAGLAARRPAPDIAAELVAAPWRVELLAEQRRCGPPTSPDGPRRQLSASVQQLSAILGRSGSASSTSRSPEERRKAAASALRDPAKQQQQAPPPPPGGGRGGAPPDLSTLCRGEPEAAIAALVGGAVQRGGGGSSGPAASTPPGAAVTAAAAAAAASGGEDPGALLLALDLRGLCRALHVAAATGQLGAFQQHYMEQRRLQMVADLQPPTAFLEAYQPYLAQVTGFFVIEAYVGRLTEGGVAGGGGGVLLWDAALRQLAVVLERALEGARAAEEMLAVKDFLLLVATALERAGYQVAPLSEILLGARGRYHTLLAASLGQAVTATVEGDVLGELLISTPQQAAAYAGLGLPWALDPPPGGRGPPPLPYPAPFTASVPALLTLMRRFTSDSASYLRSLYNPWELAPALLHHRDRVLGKLLVEVLGSKASTAAALDQVRELLLCAANAACLAAACDTLDAYTLSLARSGGGGGAGGSTGAGGKDASSSGPDQVGRPAPTATTATTSRLGSGLVGALRGLQDGAEREVGRRVAGRIEGALAAAAAKADWTPSGPPGRGTSPWVDGLLSYLQETFDAGLKLLPRSSAVALLRGALRGLAAGITGWFTPGPGGLKAFNLYALGRLQADVATCERWAGRWGVPGLGEELAEPGQLAAVLLSGKLEEVLSPEVRAARYPALDPVLLAAAADKYKELPGQAKKEPGWPTRRAVEGFAKQLRLQLVSGAG